MTFAIIILNHSSFNTIIELNETLAAKIDQETINETNNNTSSNITEITEEATTQEEKEEKEKE